ncbi:MAG: glycosyltransferase family 2 protein [Burkholderiaceae bacterium]
MSTTNLPVPSTAIQPKVTVITVVLNLVDLIERTLTGVIAQDYPNLEYIVVDGGSTDGTLDVIRRYESRMTRWVSGKDSGPYGAMNKGAALASGEWIIFMNGGDVFTGRDAISRAFALCDPAACDVIYGDGIFCGADYRFVEKAADQLTLHDGNGFSHQSAFVRVSLQREYGFDVTEKIAADYDLFLRLFKAGKVFRHVDVVVSEFFIGGLSSVSPSETIRLRHRVYKKHFPRSDVVLWTRLAALATKVAARSVVPTQLWDRVKRIRNRDKSLSLDRR